MTKDSGLKVKDTSLLTNSVDSMSNCPMLPLGTLRPDGGTELEDVVDVSISISGYWSQLPTNNEVVDI